MKLPRGRKAIGSAAGVALAVFLAWRLVRPMNIFVVSPAFERPVATERLPATLASPGATQCALCHRDFYDEWSTSLHGRAWIDPYFQADWAFDGKQQICKNCHIPLDVQQEHRVLGFADRDKWKPILADNPRFDARIQHEGVTCAACHLREGKILGPFGAQTPAHPVAKLANTNEICMRCHVVGGDRWDTFFRFPPCGTVAEIRSTAAGPAAAQATATLPDCVSCHMPLAERALVAGGAVKPVRRHLWRGGHDPEMVRKGLTVSLRETAASPAGRRSVVVTLTNAGAAHYLPTGTPDRHLTVTLRVLDRGGNVLREDTHVLRRTVLWRPFIVDLRDTRLAAGQPRSFRIELAPDREGRAAFVEASVRYHLVDAARLRRIGYDDAEPVSHEVWRERLALSRPVTGS